MNRSFREHRVVASAWKKIEPYEQVRHRLHRRHVGATYPLLHRQRARSLHVRVQGEDPYLPFDARCDGVLVLGHHVHQVMPLNKLLNRHTQEMIQILLERHRYQRSCLGIRRVLGQLVSCLLFSCFRSCHGEIVPTRSTNLGRRAPTVATHFAASKVPAERACSDHVFQATFKPAQRITSTGCISTLVVTAGTHRLIIKDRHCATGSKFDNYKRREFLQFFQPPLYLMNYPDITPLQR